MHTHTKTSIRILLVKLIQFHHEVALPDVLLGSLAVQCASGEDCVKEERGEGAAEDVGRTESKRKLK